MRNTLLFLCSLSFSLSIISCQWQPQPTATETVEIDSRVPRYTIQQELYDAASPEETSVEISIPELRATLLNGENQVIFETDISTGIDGRETPTGTFRVLERIVDKRSNKYGQYVRKDTREVIVKKAWDIFNNDSFWLVAPHKLFDYGTIRSIKKVDDKDALLVKYTSGGTTPGDSYLWIVDENNIPKSYKMYVPSMKMNGVSATWEDWITTESGTLLPTNHTFGKNRTLSMGIVKAYN